MYNVQTECKKKEYCEEYDGCKYSPEKKEKDLDTCVSLNVFVKCGDDKSYEPMDGYKNEKSDSCVVINIFVKCDQEDDKKGCPCKYEKEDKKQTCLKVNVFAECDADQKKGR